MAASVLGNTVEFSAVFLVSALAYNSTCKKTASGNIKVENPLLAIAAGAWFFIDALLVTLLAIFTFDVGIWGTREKVAPASEASTDACATRSVAIDSVAAAPAPTAIPALLARPVPMPITTTTAPAVEAFAPEEA